MGVVAAGTGGDGQLTTTNRCGRTATCRRAGLHLDCMHVHDEGAYLRIEKLEKETLDKEHLF